MRTSVSPSLERFIRGETNGADGVLSPQDLLLNVALCGETLFELVKLYIQAILNLRSCWLAGTNE